MSSKVSVHQLQDRLPELIDHVVKTDEECVVQRNGKDCAVIVSARKWRRRKAALQLDALGPAYRLSRPKQTRVEKLLAAKDKRSLAPVEEQELKSLLRRCDAIMLRRTAALRLFELFDKAVQLMEGDASAAAAWLRRPAKALGKKAPLEVAATEIGARAVEDLIGQLEFGVYS